MKVYNTYHIAGEHQGLTVEEYLKSILQYSGKKIQKLTRLKGIQLNKKAVYLQKKVKAGDVLSILVLEDKTYGVVPQEGSVDILFEDSRVIVLNKPPKILVHPAGQTAEGTMANYLAYHFQKRGEVLTVRPLHRLDRDTSGCVVFAKDAQAQTLLEQQLSTGKFKRVYYGIVEGKITPPAGIVDFSIGPHPSNANRRAVTERGEKAVTYYRTIDNIAKCMPDHRGVFNLSLLELKLETGRTHQIRVHLAHLGHPIIGDRMYGKGSSLIGRQALHAGAVSFLHPDDGQELTVYAPFPGDFERLLINLDN